MDEGVIIDCVTKEAHRAPLKAFEQAQRNTDEAEHRSRQEAAAEQAAKRDAIMEKLAIAADVSVDDMEDAFGVRKSARVR